MPLIPLYKANKKIKERIEAINNLDKLNAETEKLKIANFDILFKRNEDSIRRKRFFDKKAQANFIALSILAALLGTFPIVIFKFYCFSSPPLRWIIFSISAVGLIWLLFAAHLSFDILSDNNTVYVLEPNEIGIRDKETLSKHIMRNDAVNLIRHNYISASHSFMKIAISLLVVEFIFITIPLFYK
jgi:hypothetical protein